MWFIFSLLYLGGGGGGGGGAINLKFVFSVSSLVYLEKYGLKKYEGQKKHSCFNHWRDD